MTNELIFIVSTSLDILFMLFLLRFGKGGIFVGIIINLLLVSIFGSKLIMMFGVVTNIGNGFYAVLTFGVTLLTYLFGKKTGMRGILLGFTGLTFFILMSQFVIRTESVSATADISAAMSGVLFTSIPRIAVASMVAYLLAQTVNVFIVGTLFRRQSPLWFGVLLAMLVAQILDSILFFSIGFLGVIDMPILVQTMLIGFSVKIIIGLLCTPLVYLAKSLIVTDGRLF